ncbi:hypothetical protein [Cryobacterium arcticum]|uniref:Uncharacterized protein n=1 Tax=Cryobacterium arcticum TaxID=670052 RepID=A0A1B1BLB6_9MICO|nr:hypothetical protein [Cryobacterium arcticum]ANP73447.1 hypothetical protein PA27867_2499 [Cryobacterium arcticum]
MKRSTPRFLVFLAVLVISSCVLILTLPASLGAGASIRAWIPITVGALAAVSAVMAWLVRPKWNAG